MEQIEVSKWTGFWIVTAALFIATMFTVWACRDTPEAQAAAARAQALRNTPTPSIQVGQVTALTIGQHLVAPMQSACGEIAQLKLAGDRIGLQRLVDNDLALVVEGETQVRVIDVDLLGEWVRVRLLSGRYTTQDGWVADNEVRR